MNPIQIVLDGELLARIDREAGRSRVSRSAFVREAVRRVLDARELSAKIEADLRAYERQPFTPEEKRLARAMSRAASRVIDATTRGEKW